MFHTYSDNIKTMLKWLLICLKYSQYNCAIPKYLIIEILKYIYSDIFQT